MSRAPNNSWLLTCDDCGKRVYRSRKAARRAAKVINPSDPANAYRCRTSTQWHIGHLPPGVTAGRLSRADIYPNTHR